MRRIVAAMLLVMLVSPSAMADIRIRASGGGQIGQYLRLFAVLRASGQRIVIDGPCLSACTLIVTMVPRDRICTTRRAVLGFHAPYLPGETGRELRFAEATKIVLDMYPPQLRNWIRRKGGLTSRPIYLRGRELAALYRPCS
jgi:hypothetical protein